MSNKQSDVQIDPAHSNQGEASSSPDSDATPQGETDGTGTAAQVPIAALLEQEAMLPFAGLTLQDPREYPEEVSDNGQYSSGSPKEAIQGGDTADAEYAIERLLSRGWLYEVERELRITDRDR